MALLLEGEVERLQRIRETANTLRRTAYQTPQTGRRLFISRSPRMQEPRIQEQIARPPPFVQQQQQQ